MASTARRPQGKISFAPGPWRRCRRGIPHLNAPLADGAASLKELCEIAAKRGLLVDIHCDETDDPLSRHVDSLSYETQRLGYRTRGGLTPHVHALHGQLLCVKAHSSHG